MAKWIIDPQHSDIHFKTRHLLISTVTGEFKKFEGTVETDGDDFTNARISFSAETASVYTNNEKRDEDLRKNDFFDVDKFPKLEFHSTSLNPDKDEEFCLKGDLTIKGVSKQVALKVISGGGALDPEGRARVGFIVEGHINRYDYGLIWSLLTESGGIILAEDVRIQANVQLVKVSE